MSDNMQLNRNIYGELNKLEHNQKNKKEGYFINVKAAYHTPEWRWTIKEDADIFSLKTLSFKNLKDFLIYSVGRLHLILYNWISSDRAKNVFQSLIISLPMKYVYSLFLFQTKMNYS